MGNHPSSAAVDVSVQDKKRESVDGGCVQTSGTSRSWVIGKCYSPAVQPLEQGCGMLIHACTDHAKLVSAINSNPAHSASHGPPLAGSEAQVVGSITVTRSASGFGSASDQREVCVTWDMDVQQVFHAHDVSRSPCGSNTRLASPSFVLPTADMPTLETPEAAMPFHSARPVPRHPSHAGGPALPTADPSVRTTWSSPLLRGAIGSKEDEHVDSLPEARAPGWAVAAMQDALAPSGTRINRVVSRTQHAAGGKAADVFGARQAAATSAGLWHLEWALFDYSGSHVSLYLCHTADDGEAAVRLGHTEQQGSQQPRGTASPVLLSWDVVVQGLDSKMGDVLVNKTAHVPAHDYALSGGAPSWGAQGLLSLADLDALTATHLLRVTVRLQPERKTQQQASTPPAGAEAADFAANHTAALGQLPGVPPLRVLVASLSPRILVVDDFLEKEVCNQLMSLATPRLVRSRVSTGTETPSRMSYGTFFTGAGMSLPLIQSVEERITRLMSHPAVTGGKRKLVNTEALQVVSYTQGGFYHGHFDNRAGGPVTRHATILVYLCDCQAGGSTYFPRATAPPNEQTLPVGTSLDAVAEMSLLLHEDTQVHRPGLRIEPAAGRALIFWSALPNGQEDLASLHEAEAVQKGDKWIATRWFKEVE